jgi:hypothetical protein
MFTVNTDIAFTSRYIKDRLPAEGKHKKFQLGQPLKTLSLHTTVCVVSFVAVLMELQLVKV